MSDIEGAATQPLSPLASSSCPAFASDVIWGWLVPSVAFIPPFPLTRLSYKVGRDDAEVDLALNSAHMKEVFSGSVVQTSRLHFTLSLTKEGTVSLMDHSMNGTWVKGLRVGKGEVCCLQHSQVSFSKIVKMILVDPKPKGHCAAGSQL